MSVTPAIVDLPSDEVAGSPKESIGADGRFRATRVIECLWSDRLHLAQELYGSTTLAGNGTGIDVILPAEYPHRAGVFVKQAPTIEGWPADDCDHDHSGTGWGTSPVADYQYARITVEYETPLFGTTPGTGPRVEEDIEGDAEFLTLPSEGLYWDSNGQGNPLKPSEAPGKLIRNIDWIYHVSGLPVLPLATLTLIGNCNQQAVHSNIFGFNFPAETLLYSPPSLKRYFYVGNQSSAWDVVYRFTFKPTGWNKFYRSAVQPVPQDIFLGTGVRYIVFPLGDFTSLLA